MQAGQHSPVILKRSSPVSQVEMSHPQLSLHFLDCCEADPVWLSALLFELTAPATPAHTFPSMVNTSGF